MAEFEDQPASIRKLKQCYYELLNIDMDASEEEIRQAYKYQALRWHPDKNVSDPETAAETFRQVQQAYTVLMDPKRRIWYDKFRDRILQGNEDMIDDKCIDLEEYMTTTCYTGYEDDDAGFYAVYRNVFQELMREELPYEDEDDATPPGFGTSQSDYEDVHAFYSFWSSFCTKKTFDHLMKYDVLEAPNRRTLRAMEKENVKIREAAKKGRNEEVRRLVSFIRKRDKRVIKRKHELKNINEINRKKTEEERRKKIESRIKDLREREHVESEWTSMKSLERSLHALEKRYDREHAAAAAAASDSKGKKNGTAGNEEDEEEILILSDDEVQDADRNGNADNDDEDDDDDADDEEEEDGDGEENGRSRVSTLTNTNNVEKNRAPRTVQLGVRMHCLRPKQASMNFTLVCMSSIFFPVHECACRETQGISATRAGG